MSLASHTSTSRWILQSLLLLLLLAGIVAYGLQYQHGLGVTGLSRDAPWGLYIAQFTFMVGIGASSVTVLLPYYVYQHRAFSRAVILGETVAVIALSEALLLVLVDLGQPSRLLNVLFYPTPSSLMFWDMATLGGYLLLCVVVLGASLCCPPQSKAARLLRVLALLGVPWAFAIHIVTALLYSGLAARPGWMTAILAPRFLATAFASGPALLILLSTALSGGASRVENATPASRGAQEPRDAADPGGLSAVPDEGPVGREASAVLASIMTYATALSLLFAGLEAFTGLYSGVPLAAEHLLYLYRGLEGHWGLLPWTYASILLSLAALVLLLTPGLRRRPGALTGASLAVLVAVFLEKGLCLIPSGFVPSPLGTVADYRPSVIELVIVVGIHAGGALAWSWLGPSLLRLGNLKAQALTNAADHPTNHESALSIPSTVELSH